MPGGNPAEDKSLKDTEKNKAAIIIPFNSLLLPKSPSKQTTLLDDTSGAPAVDLDNELLRKLREALHKEASPTHKAEAGSPAPIARFLKDLFSRYGQKPDKVCIACMNAFISNLGTIAVERSKCMCGCSDSVVALES